MRVKLKVCGMRELANIQALCTLAPNYMGFIFYEGSKRFVGDMDPLFVHNLPPDIKATGVFVNAPLQEILAAVDKYRLKAVQLHGAESPAYCKQLKDELTGVQLIKAFGVNDDFNFELLTEYEDVVNYFLFDTQTAEHGGSGKIFNWTILKGYRLELPYFLSGGIGLEQVEEIKAIVDPRLYAVDVNSRFETSPAMKDIAQLTTFKNQL